MAAVLNLTGANLFALEEVGKKLGYKDSKISITMGEGMSTEGFVEKSGIWEDENRQAKLTVNEKVKPSYTLPAPLTAKEIPSPEDSEFIIDRFETSIKAGVAEEILMFSSLEELEKDISGSSLRKLVVSKKAFPQKAFVAHPRNKKRRLIVDERGRNWDAVAVEKLLMSGLGLLAELYVLPQLDLNGSKADWSDWHALFSDGLEESKNFQEYMARVKKVAL